MLVAFQIKGKWDGTKYVFDSPSARKVYHGPAAYAKGGSTSKQEFVPTGPWSGQIPYINQLFQGAAQQLEAGPPEYYPGQTVADTNPTLAASQGNIVGTTGQSTDVLSQAMQTAQQGQTQGTMAGNVGGASIPAYAMAAGGLAQTGGVDTSNAMNIALNSNGMNPYTMQIIEAALRGQNQQFSENVLPQISSAAGQAGQIGGTRQGIAEGIAGKNQALLQKDLIAQLLGQAFQTGSQERLAALGLSNQANTNLGQLTSGMITSGSQQDLTSQVQNTALLPGLSQAINANLGLQNQVGLQQQAQNQAQTDADVERWFYEQYAPMNMLTQYQNWITGAYGSSRDGGSGDFNWMFGR